MLPTLKCFRLLNFSLAICISLCALTASAQEPSDRVRGIELFKHNETTGAIAALSLAVKQNPADSEAWYFLGLARNRQNDVKGARKAFAAAIKGRYEFAPAHTAYAYSLLLTDRIDDAGDEARRALELNPNDAEAHYVLGSVYLRQGNPTEAQRAAESATKLKQVFPAAYLLKYQALLADIAERAETGWRKRNSKAVDSLEERRQQVARRQKTAERFQQAADALEIYISQSPRDQGDPWREQLATVRAYSTTGQDAFSGWEVDTRVKVLKKPAPDYTAAAQDAGVAGTVMLRAVFSGQGTVEHILVLSYLPYGLTEAAVAAAKKIKFVPATKNGKPVSMFMQLEYNFSF
ncbi:MAG TPA: TonB family protein [Pyrinomonadaceae bacterium]|nr:TonB family protein [Pyrinomonadaceae bacterium]